MGDHPVAGWYADPTGRFEHRYWDGERWTDHVARQGQAAVDPLAGGGGPDTATLDVSDVRTEAAPTGAGGAEAPGGGTEPWATPVRRTNVKAILSLLLSLAWIGGLASIAGIVLGGMARRELRERPDETGGGIAVAGIVLGVLGLLFTLLLIGAVVAFFSFGMGGDMMDPPRRP